MRPISYIKSTNELINNVFLKFYFENLLHWTLIFEEIFNIPDKEWLKYSANFIIKDFKINKIKKYNKSLQTSSKKFLDLNSNCWENFNLSLEFTSKRKKTTYFYLKYLYYFYNFLFVYNFKQRLMSFYQYRGFYDYFFMRGFLHNFLKFKGARFLFNTKIYNILESKITFKNFIKEYYPILSLFIITDLCFLFRPKNLFLILNFYGKVFLFHTAGIESGHEGRKKQPIQVRCLSNILWHLLFRERCTKINIRYLNFRNKAVFFLTMLTHLKYIKRFKNKTIKFVKFIIELKQSFGFTKGKKLAVRKRFVIRKRSLNYFSIDNYEKELKKKKNDI